jgi:hypothetical protein
MNSAQRRRANREHPHTVRISATEQERYYEHDEKVHRAVQWCKKNCKDSWRTNTDWDFCEFKFTNQKDAIYFALKWS